MVERSRSGYRRRRQSPRTLSGQTNVPTVCARGADDDLESAAASAQPHHRPRATVGLRVAGRACSTRHGDVSRPHLVQASDLGKRRLLPSPSLPRSRWRPPRRRDVTRLGRGITRGQPCGRGRVLARLAWAETASHPLVCARSGFLLRGASPSAAPEVRGQENRRGRPSHLQDAATSCIAGVPAWTRSARPARSAVVLRVMLRVTLQGPPKATLRPRPHPGPSRTWSGPRAAPDVIGQTMLVRRTEDCPSSPRAGL